MSASQLKPESCDGDPLHFHIGVDAARLAASDGIRGNILDPKDKEREETTLRLIADLRLRLLDLTNRNRLLNFKFSDRSRSHVRVIDELPDFLHAELVEGKKLWFKALPEPLDEPLDEKTPEFRMAMEEALRNDEEYRRTMENLAGPEADPEAAQKAERELRDRLRAKLGLSPSAGHGRLRPVEYARELGWDPSFDLPLPAQEGQKNRPHHEDDQIRTLLFPDQLQRKLSGIREGARTSLEEQGVGTLFVAFGFLEWYEALTSERAFFAPLLLHPLEMTQELVKQTYRYSIASTGDETEVNLTLKERLRKDFQLELPAFSGEQDLEGYLHKVEVAIAEMKGWRIRRFVTVGLFSFGRLVMYQDLDPENWLKAPIQRHPILLDLLGGSDPGSSIVAVDYDVDTPEVEAKVPLLINDADSSQISAIVDVMTGRSMAVKGPPGTGKSQTITNVIAAAMAAGKNVLFVAAKSAALEVVKKRLDAAGLGDFCLELHSTKARKMDIVDSLRKRLEIHDLREPRDFSDILRELKDHRRQLSNYVMKLNSPLAQTGRTLQENLWRATRARDRARQLGIADALGLKHLTLQGALEWSGPEAESKRSALTAFEAKAKDVLKQYGALDRHPWACLGFTVRSPFELEDAVGLVVDWNRSLQRLWDTFVTMASRIPECFPATPKGARDLVRCLGALPTATDGCLPSLLPVLRAEGTAKVLENYVLNLERHSREWEAVRGSVNCGSDALPKAQTIEQVVQGIKGSGLCMSASATIGDLQPLLERCRLLAHQAHQLKRGVDLVASASGINDPLPMEAVPAAIYCLSIAGETSPNVLALRSPTLYGLAARRSLEGLDATAKSLLKERGSIENRSVFSYEEGPQEYLRCAWVLRVTGVFGRLFGREYRLAKGAWYAMQKEVRKGSPFVMAKELEEVGRHIERYRSFMDNEEAKAICGPSFRGLETRFDLLGQVNAFGDSVERELSGASAARVALRRLLLEGEASTLERLRGVASGISDTADRFLREMESFRLEPAAENLDDLECRLHAAAERLSEVIEALAELPLLSSVRLVDLPGIARRLALLASIRAQIDGDAELSRLLGDGDLYGEPHRDAILATLKLHQEILSAQLPVSYLDWLLVPEIPDRVKIAEEVLAGLADAIEAEASARGIASVQGGIDCTRAVGSAAEDDCSLEDSARRLDTIVAARDTAAEWAEITRVRKDVEDLGLGDFLEAAWGHEDLLTDLRATFDHVYFSTLIREAFQKDLTIARFSGVSLEQARLRFQYLDKQSLRLQREALAARLSRAAIPAGIGTGPKRNFTERALIFNETSKRKRVIPLRDLFRRSGRAIQCLKPCWMMSPASVAQFVSRDSAVFDLVVIDEASQMRPEEAIGATARGRQILVVGDPKQLPPTSFFDAAQGIDEDMEDAEDYVDSESILDMALAVFVPSRDLRWHYRSRHESLIAFSNRHFYDNRLVLFPSCLARHPDLGVEFRFVDGRYTKGGINLPEIQAVTMAAADFMRRFPKKSLGIATMNIAQADLLQEQMDALFAQHEDLEAYRAFWADKLESLFIKNLERVQGDERDAIFISLVYGPDESGRVLQRFGPINSEMGYRRLNVLLTRAKEKVVVFSSMRHSDVIPTPTSHEGVRVLRDYLRYAETGRMEVPTPSGRPPDSEFEETVAERLRRHGYEIVAQVGEAGYFIDLAVRSQRRPDTYLLGIECDGATYHSAKSARDRDRLRQEVLESLGWKLYRIWSTDWFENPDRETQKLVGLVKRLAAAEVASGQPE